MTELTNRERGAIDRIDAGDMLAQVERWAAINSGTRNLAGVAAMADVLADAFAALPGEIAMVEAEPVESVGADGNVTVLEHGRHLHLRVRPEAPVRMLLTGHMDTVYPADHPFQAVTHRDDGTVNGPGTADMKGGLSVMLAALSAMEESGVSMGYDVVINSDEETGSFSSAGLLARAARGKVAALTYEPALPDGTLAGARGGTGNFSILVRGRSAHAGRNPDDGRNAVVAAAAIALRLIEARGPRLSVNPARIDGGGPNNVVPDLAVLRVNFRPASLDDIERAQAHIDAAASAVAASARDVQGRGAWRVQPAAQADRSRARRPPVRADQPRAGTAIWGWRSAGAHTGGVCDGNNIAAAGVPVVDTMGVRGGAIHSPEEFMIIDSLKPNARRFPRSRSCGLHRTGPKL